jgi:hypothetical protein
VKTSGELVYDPIPTASANSLYEAVNSTPSANSTWWLSPFFRLSEGLNLGGLRCDVAQEGSADMYVPHHNTLPIATSFVRYKVVQRS